MFGTDRIKRHKRVALLVVGGACLIGAALAFTGCHSKAKSPPDLSKDQVVECGLSDIRLGDGVPVGLTFTIRWRVAQLKAFQTQINTPERYAEAVLRPKAREAASRVANAYPSVDVVFKADRQKFLEETRAALAAALAEDIITVKEVVISDLVFPQKYTEALEQLSLKEREMAAIREKNAVELEAARAAELKAEADGKVEIKNAEVEGKVMEIRAKAEDQRRLSAMAKAETEAQISERQAKAEAARQRLLAEAEADRQRQLSKARLEEQKALKELEVQKQRDLDQVALEREKTVAGLCASSPAYASFLINRELASKVQIAVVPTGSDSGFLGGLIQNATPKLEARASR